ncbi:MAG: FtsX-like permease family protein [Bacillota bacterium]
MTLRQLALSNMRGLWRKYAAFLFSSILAVVVFYLLASFVMHPDVVNGYVAHAAAVLMGFLVSQWIIVTFTFFFVLYSSWAFVKSRKKEFGLLCLLGATRGQVSWMIVIEHAVIGILSIAAGLGLGIPGSKLMLDAMSRFLQVSSPVRFIVVVPAVLTTIGVFMVMFIAIGAFTTLQISPRRVVRLLREHQRPKALPRYSVIIALLAFLCIGGGYGVAWVVDGQTLVFAMLPVTFVVSFGTFLFFSQASVAVLRMLQRKLSFFYNRLNLLTVGDLVFRMKENAWVLATVAVLSASVITATGTIYTAQATMLKDMEAGYPHTVTFAVSGELGFADKESGLPALASGIDKLLAHDEVTVAEHVALAGLMAKSRDGDIQTLIASERGYNAWAATAGREALVLDGSKAAMLQPFMDRAAEMTEEIPVDLIVGGETITVEAVPHPFLHTNYLHALQQFVVVDDALYDRLSAAASSGDRVSFFSYEFQDWQKTWKTDQRLRATIPDADLVGFSSRIYSYEGRRQMTALTAMIAMFVTVLFFIAAGSMLYFRLFGSIQEDREKYRSMRRLGLSTGEVNRIISTQVKVIFFAPIAIGSVHCGFAMKSLSNVLRQMPWPFLGVYRYALYAIAGFSLVQAVYFLVARNAYVKEVTDGLLREQV